LVHENRIFSIAGLELINSNRRAGILALREAAGNPHQTADAADIAFRMAPRLNAAGRMQHASIAVDLLTTDDLNRAAQIAQSLNGFNQKRRELEQKIIDHIAAQIAKQPQLLESKTLVLWDRQWHEGVLGIVASRMVEKYYRPVVIIAVKEDICKGSARSISGVDLYEQLLACGDVLEKFGGHEMAAGLSLKAENLELFQNRFENSVGQQEGSIDLRPKIFIDQELNFTDISERLIGEIESLAPFGTGNPEPIFMSRNVKVASSKIVGSNHRRMVLTQPQNSDGKMLNAIHFNIDTEQPLTDTFDKIAFKIRWNRWKGTKTAQIVIEDVQ